MEIILSKQCKSLTGSLGRGFGYFIVARWSRKDVKFRFYSQRSKWDVPADGHLRFIFACAQLAQMKTHITDIRVPRKELAQALAEAGYSPPVPRCPVLASSASEIPAPDFPVPEIFSASDIINYRRDYLPNQA